MFNWRLRPVIIPLYYLMHITQTMEMGGRSLFGFHSSPAWISTQPHLVSHKINHCCRHDLCRDEKRFARQSYRTPRSFRLTLANSPLDQPIVTNRLLQQAALLEGLNPAQREAVTAEIGPILVLAGPGSGKTRVLTHRIGWLMLNGAPGASILAVTFTNKAANEMRRRLKALLGVRSDSQLGVTVGTFHGVCVQILRAHAAQAGLSARFAIFDADQQLTLVQEAMARLGLDPQRCRPAAVLSAISRLKSDGLGPARALEFRGAATAGQRQFLTQVAGRWGGGVFRG